MAWRARRVRRLLRTLAVAVVVIAAGIVVVVHVGDRQRTTAAGSSSEPSTDPAADPSVTDPAADPLSPAAPEPSADPAPDPSVVDVAQPIRGAGTLRTLIVPTRDAGTGGHRSVIVYTPDVALPDDLPVVYLLHGLPGAAGDLCTDSAAHALDALFRSGVRPFVLACPDGATDESDSEWANSASGTTTLETFVTTQVVSAVEGSHIRPRSMRALAGFSMGGFAAASIALRNPLLYSQVVCLAGYFDIDDPEDVFGSDPRDHDPTALIDRAANFRWYLAEAAQDSLALTAHASEGYANLLRSRGDTVSLHVTTGQHGPAWARAQLSSYATFLSAGWPAP